LQKKKIIDSVVQVAKRGRKTEFHCPKPLFLLDVLFKDALGNQNNPIPTIQRQNREERTG
jgi:hypothetical protein